MPKYLILTGEKYLVEAETEEEAMNIFLQDNEAENVTHIEADTWSTEC